MTEYNSCAEGVHVWHDKFERLYTRCTRCDALRAEIEAWHDREWQAHVEWLGAPRVYEVAKQAEVTSKRVMALYNLTAPPRATVRSASSRIPVQPAERAALVAALREIDTLEFIEGVWAAECAECRDGRHNYWHPTTGDLMPACVCCSTVRI